ncbi:MAG: hypothetical protein QME62_12730 [Armatimonadota bacterium]|nr:hypothetical protein [Armatimonadota bacterium]
MFFTIATSIAFGNNNIPTPKKFLGMLQNGKPFIATMYYERYYNLPDEYPLMDRDLEDLAARGWTVAFTDYTHLSLSEVWDHYYEKAKSIGIYVMPDQWNACFHAGGPFFSRIKLPITETGSTPTGFAIGAQVRFCDQSFIDAMVEYQSQVLSRYINHPAFPRILGLDGEHHPVMLVIYETGMADYDGHWIDYSPDTAQQFVEYQKKRIGKILAIKPPKPSEKDKQEALVLWNDFRAEYLSNGWCAVARGLKAKFPGLYAMVCFRQHGLLEGSKSGVNQGGIGRRAIRPELWQDFDIICTEHDGDDGIEYLLADADLIKSAAKGRIGALEYYLDSGYKAWSARPVEFHRPWSQAEMLGTASLRGLLPLHYGYNERDDRAGIASMGRREKDAPLWQKKTCIEAAEANANFHQIAPYVYAAKPVHAKAAIVMPYEAYALSNDDELALDRWLVKLHNTFIKYDISADWVFTSAKEIARYNLLVVPSAPYSKEFNQAIEKAEKNRTKVFRLSLKDEFELSKLEKRIAGIANKLRVSKLPRHPNVETGLLIGDGYEVDVAVNHGSVPIYYSVADDTLVFPKDKARRSTTIVLRPHSSIWIVRSIHH